MKFVVENRLSREALCRLPRFQAVAVACDATAAFLDTFGWQGVPVLQREEFSHPKAVAVVEAVYEWSVRRSNESAKVALAARDDLGRRPIGMFLPDAELAHDAAAALATAVRSGGSHYLHVESALTSLRKVFVWNGPVREGVESLFQRAYNGGRVFERKWRTRTVGELADNKEDYPILLDALIDQGCPEDWLTNLREGAPSLSDWATFHCRKK